MIKPALEQNQKAKKDRKGKKKAKKDRKGEIICGACGPSRRGFT